MADVSERIRGLIEPILVSRGLQLWDLEFRKEGPRWLLRVYLDREGTGVTLDDCEAVSRDLSALLDVEDVISHAYTLEVSSPGLDRSLTMPEHYRKCAGSRIRIKTFQPVDGQKVLFGLLKGLAEGDTVVLQMEKGPDIRLPLSNIAKANLVVTA
jgi:ribosome maturation factor RimP